MENIYRYRSNGRAPTVWGMLAFWLFMVWAIEASNDPALFLRVIYWGLLGLVIWALIYNPKRGIDLSDTELTIISTGKPRTINLEDIDRLSVRESGISGFSFRLHMKDAKPIGVSSAALPSAREIEAELEARGVTVDIKTVSGV
ncbi:hypothetical protein [Octadecabacter ascidiaceicola]|uniref:PH domain-containing protein n=1 Tax=Octadecabacter ascidiaceicola TaxID=1655543 RepID=A0A238JTQ2_9RHOB|nr:hypothetical protein [Octadecabacter ascidiaceicola]SMX33574.1 hypothetical protein OCA8868_00978 [Octadecabacter ascidiaceicola]